MVGASYACTRAAANLWAWDVIGIGSADVVLLQAETRDWTGETEMETLRLFPSPPNRRKLVHRRRDWRRQPDVKEIGT